MRRRLIIHAGRHKTGSSAIQEYLYGCLDDPDFEYLDVGRANASLIINRSFRSNWLVKNSSACGEPPVQTIMENALEKLSGSIQLTQKPNVILSAEEISLLSEEEFERFLNFFSQYFDTIELHAYFRPPKDDMESGFPEKLKSALVDCNGKIIYGHKRRFEMFEQHLGVKNMFYYRYHCDDFPQGDVVAHFCNALGMKKVPAEKSSVNRRLSLPAVQLLYTYRRYFPESSSSEVLLLDMLHKLSGPDFRFHSSLFRKCYSDPHNSFVWLESKTGKSFREDLEKHDSIGISAEADFFQLDSGTIDWLKDQFPAATQLRSVQPMNPGHVAKLLRTCTERAADLP